MSGRIGLLSGLLALQFLVVAAVLLLESGVGDADEGPLLSFDAAAVDEVRISAPEDDAELVVSRAEDGWRLPDGLPADADKVQQLLERLAEAQAPWPVATSGSARERFEVTEETHQRHVVLSAGGETVADLYLGTSPGYQRVHARRADGDAVYSIELSNYQVPAAAAEWLDKTLLQPDGEITAVARVGAWRVLRKDDGWQLDQTPAAEGAPLREAAPPADGATHAADQDAASQLVRRLGDLRVMGLADAPAADAESVAEFRISDADGDHTLTLWRQGDDEPFTVRSSRRDEHFELASYLGDQLLVERAALLPAEPDEAAESDEADEAHEAAEAAAAGVEPEDDTDG